MHVWRQSLRGSVHARGSITQGQRARSGVSHLEGGDIESPVDEDPGDSLRTGWSAERSLIGDEAKGFWEQELQAQVLKKVGIICADIRQA